MKPETIPCRSILPDPDQPRRHMDDEQLKQLALSIRDLGQLQPLIVCRGKEGFLLVDGHRRWRALKLAGQEHATALVLPDRPDPDTLLLTQLAANCMRADLKPTELATAYQRLQESRQWTQSQLARALHVSPSRVTQVLAYLTLPPKAQELLDAGELAGSTAYAICRAPNEQARDQMLRKALHGQLKRDDALREVSQRSSGKRFVRSKFRLPGSEVSIAAEERFTLDECMAALRELLRECRRAAKQGLDVSTLERVLHDRMQED